MWKHQEMTKTLSLTISLAAAVFSMAVATAPSHAATRLMNSSLEGFQYRCENHGGIFSLDGAVASCQTPSVPVACEYFEDRKAICDWPGIERQMAVVQVIGTLPDVPSDADPADDSGDGDPKEAGAGQYDDDDFDYTVPEI